MRINRFSPGLQNEPELYTFNDNRMNKEVTMEDRLWDFIDGLSSPAEKSAIETLIAENVEWQRKYKELLQVHQLMSHSELEEPSMRFTRNVMEEIGRVMGLDPNTIKVKLHRARNRLKEKMEKHFSYAVRELYED